MSVALQHQPFHVGLRALRFFDLRVYRGAALLVAHGRPLYRHALLRDLGFTYPPFAGLVVWPASLASLALDKLAVTALNTALLVFTLRRALMLARPVAPIDAGRRVLAATRSEAWALAALAGAAALWLEPVSVALGYGQIDILILALVVGDLSLPDAARGKGAGIGLAAAIKLTPLMFIPYLLLSGRRRAAFTSAATFAIAGAVSFAVLPADAGRYWGGLIFDFNRVGGVASTSNQSLYGALARLLADHHPGLLVFIVAATVGLLGLLLASRKSRAGNEAAGYALCALATLLTSPVSWTHHWTLAVPALLLLAVVAHEQRARRLALGAAAMLALGYCYLPERAMAHRTTPSGLRTLAEDPYVLAGMCVLALCVVPLLGGATAGLPSRVGWPLRGSADTQSARQFSSR